MPFDITFFNVLIDDITQSLMIQEFISGVLNSIHFTNTS